MKSPDKILHGVSLTNAVDECACITFLPGGLKHAGILYGLKEFSIPIDFAEKLLKKLQRGCLLN